MGIPATHIIWLAAGSIWLSWTFSLRKSQIVNAGLGDDETALIEASSTGGKSLDALQILIGKAADVNLQNRI